MQAEQLTESPPSAGPLPGRRNAIVDAVLGEFLGNNTELYEVD